MSWIGNSVASTSDALAFSQNVFRTSDRTSTGAPVLQSGGSEGSHRNQPSSGYALLETLIPVFVVAAASFVAFLFLRRKDPHSYVPRTYLDILRDDEKTPPPSGDGYFNWLPDFFRVPDTDVLNKHSLDAYLYLRFFKMTAMITFVGCCMTWPILFPVNATGGGHQSQLDILSIGNVVDPNRFYAHVFVAWIFLGFVMFTITRETIFYINLRQAYLMSPWNVSRVSSRTVLFTSVPQKLLDEEKLRQSFNSVKRVWIVPECPDLKELVKKRDGIVAQLENAEVDVCTKENGHQPTGSRFFKSSDRPTQRVPKFYGKKVDTITRCHDRIAEVTAEIVELQKAHEKGEQVHAHAVFIEFETVSAAQAAFQMTAHHAPLQMESRCISVVPSAIIWDNVGISSWQRIVRQLAATGLVAALTIFWSIPVAALGALTNINYLTQVVPFLKFLKDLPPSVLGLITGLLPSLLLSYVVSLVPSIHRYIAESAGEISKAHIELQTQEWYFAFQVIQVFLVTTFTSGAAAVTGQIIDDPKSAPELLAKNLPKAANFYISWFIVYGLGQSSKYLLNISGYLQYHILGWLFDRTPRDKYNRYTKLSGMGWGSMYPKFTNLVVIAISYSTIAPFMLGFAVVGLLCLYFTFRYNQLYVVDANVDTQGQAYFKALQQLTTGVYLSEFCLIGLFAISTKRDGQSSGPLVLMIIFTVLTIIYHVIMHKALTPLTKILPNNVLNDYEGELPTQSEPDERQTARDEEEGTPLLSGGLKKIANPKTIVERFLKFFEPQKYASYNTLHRQLLRSNLGNSVPELPIDKEKEAYLHPAVAAKMPIVWIASDGKGISKKEIEKTPDGINITDHGAEINEKGRVVWDKDQLKKLPLWKDPVCY